MNIFPPIVLRNDYYIGDNVIIEPIADILTETFPEVYVYGRQPHYSDLYFNHPRVKSLMHMDDAPFNSRIIDLSEAISSVNLTTDKDNRVIEGTIIPHKLRRMYEAAGISYNRCKRPRLYLSNDEIRRARDFRQQFGGKCVAVVLRSRHEVKDWPYINKLIKRLLHKYYNIFILTEELVQEDEEITGLNVNLLINMTVREMMWKLSVMDAVIGVDTGPIHIAGALKVPIVVITRDIWADLYEPYDNKAILAVGNKEYDNQPVDYKKYIIKHPLSAISVREVKKAVNKVIIPDIVPETFEPERIFIRTKPTDIGIFRLDGLGGSVTVVDHAKKIYEKTGIKSTLIVRSYKELFAGNPYINDVILVGSVKWGECLAEMMKRFNVMCELRFALGKWHQREGYKIFDQDYSKFNELFEQFPLHYNKLESYKMHHVQISDMQLGLPYDTIDIDIYKYDEPNTYLPKEYIVVSNGVDAIHKGARQTKMWDYWDELTELVGVPLLQVGTLHDQPIYGAIDMRGKTSIPQLCTTIRDSTAVLCCEGGLMHLAYAVKAKNVFVLRGPTRGKLFEYPGHKFIDSYICNNCWSTAPDWYTRCHKGIDAVCMKSISPERVAFNIEGVLNEVMV